MVAALSCVASAQQANANDLANYGLALDAKIEIGNFTLTESPQTVKVSVVAHNPQESSMPLYVIRKGEAGWEVVGLLGAIPPKSDGRLELDVEVRHDRETQRRTWYAVVGRGDDGQLYGSAFELVEDWSGYEKAIEDGLKKAVVVAAPALGLLLAVVAVAAALTAYGGRPKHRGGHTFEAIELPKPAGTPLGEQLAALMTHPAAMIIELACVALFVALLLDSVSEQAGTENGMNIMVLSGIGSFAIPFLYFLAAWKFARHEEGKPLRLFVSMFAWGMFAAFLSFAVSSGLVSELRQSALLPSAIIATMFISPLVEETIKGLGVLLLSGHRDYNDSLSGMMLGFACGVGFAFVENWFYFSSRANPFDMGMLGWASFILYRSFFNTLAHGCFTAAIATTLGYVKSNASLRKYAFLAFIPGLIMAISIHTIFNLSAVADSMLLPTRQSVFFVFNPLLIILLAAMFFLVLVLAVIDEKRRRMGERARAAISFSTIIKKE